MHRKISENLHQKNRDPLGPTRKQWASMGQTHQWSLMYQWVSES